MASAGPVCSLWHFRGEALETTGAVLIAIIRRVAIGVGAAVMVLAASPAPPGGASVAPAALPFQGHGSIGEAYVVGATPGERLTVVDPTGAVVGSGVVDRLGSLIVRNLAPGSGFRFVKGTGAAAPRTAPFAVLSKASTPGASFYAAQHLHAGLNYVRMRDGVLLAATVRLPPGKSLADGPFPTVIEYSGYGVAGPHSLIDALEGKKPSNDPLLPDTSTVVGSALAPLFGFATVSLQMRGTGCSGGAFDLFGLPSDYDGYDAVQTVGSQPWVLHHKVGMVGISYSGFSQLVVAGTRPPDLAAVTPLSPTDDLYSTGYPGGIYNDGFAASWVSERVADAEPAPPGGQRWARAEIAAGDTTCLANQRLHAQAESLASLVSPGLARTPSLFDRRSPVVWASHITVPVFLVGALQDEQVGPQWPALVTALQRDKNVYVTMMNGTHIDSLGPDTIARWLEFLEIYVAGRVPRSEPALSALAPVLYGTLTGAKSVALPAVRFTTEPTVAAARAGFAAQDPRVPGALRQRRGRPRARSAATHLRGGVLGLASRGHHRALPPRSRWLPGHEGHARRRNRHLPARPRRPPGGRPAASGRPVGRPAALRLDGRPGGERGRLRDPGLHPGDDDRRPGQPRPVPPVDGARHRPAGHGDRGPPGGLAGGIRHVGLPAQQRPHALARLDPAPSRPHLRGVRSP